MRFEVIGKSGWSAVSKIKGKIEKYRSEQEDKQKKQDFIKDLIQARNDLQAARTNYDFAEDTELLEYYIYEIKAAETRLNYFLQMAKKENLSNDGFLSETVLRPRRGVETV